MDSYRKEIKEFITSLSDRGRLVFAVLTCEKLYPNYVFFQKETNWGDPSVLENAIILIYESILKEDVDLKAVQEAISEVDLITPDTEEFPGIITSFSLDACTAVYSTLSYLIDHNIENIIDVAIYARDTVDMFVQEKENLSYNDPLLEFKIDSDSFMIAEKNRQKTLALELKSIEDLTISSIGNFRNSNPIIDINLL